MTSGGSSGVQMATFSNESFLILANGAKGAAAVKLVEQALEAPNVFVFGELLDHANISALASDVNGDGEKTINLLRLFAFGTYRQFLAEKASMPQLSQRMEKKLKLLTLASLATQSRTISYEKLKFELEVNSVRELEDLIIEATSANVVHGRMDQKGELFEVDDVMGRDIRKEKDLPGIIDTLSQWCESCDVLLSNLESEVMKANETKAEGLRNRASVERKINDIRTQIKSQQQDGGEDPDSRMDTSDGGRLGDGSRRAEGKKGKQMKGLRQGGGGGGGPSSGGGKGPSSGGSGFWGSK